ECCEYDKFKRTHARRTVNHKEPPNRRSPKTASTTTIATKRSLGRPRPRADDRGRAGPTLLERWIDGSRDRRRWPLERNIRRFESWRQVNWHVALTVRLW